MQDDQTTPATLDDPPADAGGDTPPPAAPPAPDGDSPHGEAVPPEPTDRVGAPTQISDCYMVLWARKPRRGESKRPAYTEVGYYVASSADAAKRKAMDANAYLHHSAAQKPGILLRAVPARSWPHKVDATTFEAGPPQLVIR